MFSTLLQNIEKAHRPLGSTDPSPKEKPPERVAFYITFSF